MSCSNSNDSDDDDDDDDGGGGCDNDDDNDDDDDDSDDDDDDDDDGCDHDVTFFKLFQHIGQLLAPFVDIPNDIILFFGKSLV